MKQSSRDNMKNTCRYIIEFSIQILAICFSIATTSIVEKRIEQNKIQRHVQECLQVIREDLFADVEGVRSLNEYVNYQKQAGEYLTKACLGELDATNRDSVCVFGSSLLFDRPAQAGISSLSLLNESVTTSISDPSLTIQIAAAYNDFEAMVSYYNNCYNNPKMVFVRQILSSSDGQSHPGEESYDYYCRVFKSEQGKALLQFVRHVQMDNRFQAGIISIKEGYVAVDGYLKSKTIKSRTQW